MEKKQQFFEAILGMTFGELQEVAGDLSAMVEVDSDFSTANRDCWAWLLYGYAESNIEE